MKSRKHLLFGLAVAVTFAWVATGPVAADDTCLSGLSGNYAFTLSGFLQAHAGQPIGGNLAFAETGLRKFNGEGGFTDSHDSASLAGATFSPEASGTYAFDSDSNCTTGTMTLEGGLTERFTLMNGGQEMVFLVTTPSRVMFGSMKKQ